MSRGIAAKDEINHWSTWHANIGVASIMIVPGAAPSQPSGGFQGGQGNAGEKLDYKPPVTAVWTGGAIMFIRFIDSSASAAGPISHYAAVAITTVGVAVAADITVACELHISENACSVSAVSPSAILGVIVVHDVIDAVAGGTVATFRLRSIKTESPLVAI